MTSASLCGSGFIAVQPVFWTLPTGYLAGTAAAGGIALINSLGALGGFVAPNLKNWAEATFQSPGAGLFVLAATTLVGSLLILGVTMVGIRGRDDKRALAGELEAAATGPHDY